MVNNKGNEIVVKTGKPEFDNFYALIRSFLEQDVMEVNIDGQNIRGYRSPDAKSIWIRDYSEIMRGMKYFEPDLKSTVSHFAATQAENGRIFDYFTTFPEKLPSERENWTKYVRVPVEADVEYRFIKAAFLAWQVTGDDAWLQKLLPKMEKALSYIITHPWRWQAELGVVKRPYTIDTWDFAYTAGKYPWLQFQVTNDSFWGVMHGDNSGYYEAFRIMAHCYNYFGNKADAVKWLQRANDLKTAMNRVCWNGKFYTHFVKLTPVEIPGVNESAQLSLSNPMDINRGVASHDMARSIINEYIKRGKSTGAFVEWFSIDPPFPSGIFGDEKLVAGAYINGGIMPLVGGELAKAAFDHGFETFGVDILKRYYNMISQNRETYLWYFPDGRPSSVETSTSPDATPTDGWGSSAMLYGFVEGLAGVEDKQKLFQKVRLSPKWVAAGVDAAEVEINYATSKTNLKYQFQIKNDTIDIVVKAHHSEVDFHVMLPEKFLALQVSLDGVLIPIENERVESSNYVNFSCLVRGTRKLQVQMQSIKL
ncbi:MAG: hypothetical protein SCK70_04555 [bacterium]|nr:hypothetical protein [bacterium]